MELSVVEILFVFWISLLIWILIEILVAKRNKQNKINMDKKLGNTDNNIDHHLKS